MRGPPISTGTKATLLTLWILVAPAFCAWATLKLRWSFREQCEVCALVGILIGMGAAIVVNHVF